MVKIKKAWFCSSCGNESTKWMGKCPACGEWNTMVEEVISKDTSSSASRNRLLVESSNSKPVKLREISLTEENRIKIGNTEVERILGGGIVEGSMILIGGEPGIGKSTLSLQIPLGCREYAHYMSREKSLHVRLNCALSDLKKQLLLTIPPIQMTTV